MRARQSLRMQQHGAIYLVLIFVLAISGALLAGFGQVWATAAQREKEVQLLHVGNAYRQAIVSYYNATSGDAKQFPRRLEDLLLDKRFPDERRHLRQLYPDPFSGKADWQLVVEQGAVIGVRSRDMRKPIKRAGFEGANQDFSKAASYNDWQFIGR